MENCVRLNIQVSKNLRAEVKKRAAIREISVKDYVTRALIAQIKKEMSYEVQSEKVFAVPEDDL
jgi:hypothetical protein